VSGDADATSATPPSSPNNPGPPELEEIWRNLRKNTTGWVSVAIGLSFVGVMLIYNSTNDSGKDISVEVRKLVQVTPVPDSTQSSAQVVLQDCSDCPEMQLVRGGTFMMGSNTAEKFESPLHKVEVADFYVSKWPVTRKEWNYYIRNQKVIDKELEMQDVSDIAFEMLPATGITYFGAKGYVEWLATEYQGTYRLISEAEWEYAARAGSTTNYFFGNDEAQLGDYAWYSENSGNTLHPVAQKKPNPLGLYDIYGNIYQLVNDCWHSGYVGAYQSASSVA
jgi:formylglycine-generating enzyme required for sulfatase activity